MLHWRTVKGFVECTQTCMMDNAWVQTHYNSGDNYCIFRISINILSLLKEIPWIPNVELNLLHTWYELVLWKLGYFPSKHSISWNNFFPEISESLFWILGNRYNFPRSQAFLYSYIKHSNSFLCYKSVCFRTPEKFAAYIN